MALCGLQLVESTLCIWVFAMKFNYNNTPELQYTLAMHFYMGTAQSEAGVGCLQKATETSDHALRIVSITN